MFQETYFTFDDISSETFGLICARTENGMFSRSFGVNRDIITERVQHNPLNFDFGYTKESFQGEILIAGRNTVLSPKLLSEIAGWLYKDDYKPLVSNEYPDIIYYVKFNDEGELYLGSNDNGYITLSFTANAPWGWSRPYERTFNLNITGEADVVIDNMSDINDYNGLTVCIECPPNNKNIDISGGYSICNTRNTNESDAFVIGDYCVGKKAIDRYSLQKGETIYIDMGRKMVESDNDIVPNRVINCNKKWVHLSQGQNILKLKGHGIFTIKFQCPVII